MAALDGKVQVEQFATVGRGGPPPIRRVASLPNTREVGGWLRLTRKQGRGKRQGSIAGVSRNHSTVTPAAPTGVRSPPPIFPWRSRKPGKNSSWPVVEHSLRISMVPSVCHILTVALILWPRCYHCPHFTGEETKAPGRKGASPAPCCPAGDSSQPIPRGRQAHRTCL